MATTHRAAGYGKKDQESDTCQPPEPLRVPGGASIYINLTPKSLFRDLTSEREYFRLAASLRGSMDGLREQLQTAPFVAKAYQMVCDPRTDALVRWGGHNNSFLIADPAAFSQLLLPCFFKHSNFSSFVRQLNTYGFRKVHPDRWEFAHESFLRGQTHLLPRIVRRKKRGEGGCSSSGGEAEEEELFEEVERLRQEQTAIGDELARMNRRLQATERRPDQLMSFLARLAEDPVAAKVQLLRQAAEKKRQRTQLPSRPPLQPAPAPPPPQPTLQPVQGDDAVWQWAEQKPLVLPTFEQPIANPGVQQVPELGGLTETAKETPFPFCLLGECFL